MEIKTPIEWNDFAEDFLDADGNIFRADQIATALNLATDREKRLVEALEQVPREVPTNWCDSLLSGKNAAVKTADNREIEALLLGIQNRQRDFVAKALAQHKGEK